MTAVITMPPALTVRVTDKHIAEGVRCDDNSCPVALAVIDALAGAGIACGAVSVECEYVQADFFEGGAERVLRMYHAELPPRASDFVWDFDGEKPVVPFEMVLEFREVVS